MKCTKCGFISFDFNQFCPKCNRGLAEEQRRFNLPSFRPEPPMLLTRLLGETYDDTQIDVMTDQSKILEEADEATGAGLYDSLKELEEDKLALEDEGGLGVLSFGSEEHEPAPLIPKSPPKGEETIRDEEIFFNLGDIPFDDIVAGDAGLALSDKKAEPENAPAVEFDLFKDNGTLEALKMDSAAEDLTKEIDMQKFKKGSGKGERKPG